MHIGPYTRLGSKQIQFLISSYLREKTRGCQKSRENHCICITQCRGLAFCRGRKRIQMQ
uniref:Uncharacterized protein n=1 Tax=Setaria italica TaxID=4555 RepID=K3YFS4_SETIT